MNTEQLVKTLNPQFLKENIQLLCWYCLVNQFVQFTQHSWKTIQFFKNYTATVYAV